MCNNNNNIVICNNNYNKNNGKYFGQNFPDCPGIRIA